MFSLIQVTKRSITIKQNITTGRYSGLQPRNASPEIIVEKIEVLYNRQCV